LFHPVITPITLTEATLVWCLLAWPSVCLLGSLTWWVRYPVTRPTAHCQTKDQRNVLTSFNQCYTSSRKAMMSWRNMIIIKRRGSRDTYRFPNNSVVFKYLCRTWAHFATLHEGNMIRTRSFKVTIKSEYM